jgi:photosystem II stability/assembly factor-like uncharacterized protein
MRSIPIGIRLAAVLAAALAGGATWAFTDVVARPSIQSERAAQSLLLAVTRAGSRLVAVGERGIALLSDDNGKSWRQARVPVSVTLTGVRFVGAKLGWATGHSGVLLSSSDGGETWSKRLDGTALAKIVLDAELAKGAAAEPAQLAEAQRLVADGPDKPLLDVCFVSPELGFIVGAYGLFLRTADGGKTWEPWQSRLPNLQGRHLTRIAPVNGDLYIVGEQGRAYLSTDGGTTFHELGSPYRGTFFGIAALPGNAVAIFGLRGNVFRVANHGTAWTRLVTPTPATYSASAQLASGEALIASQTGDLLRSVDGGASLVPVETTLHTLASAVAEAPDGALIIAGRGMTRLLPNGAMGDRP